MTDGVHCHGQPCSTLSLQPVGEAICARLQAGDCFVAALLAMTDGMIVCHRTVRPAAWTCLQVKRWSAAQNIVVHMVQQVVAIL